MKKTLVIGLALVPVLSFSYMRKVPESDPYYGTLVNAQKQDEQNRVNERFRAGTKDQMTAMRRNGSLAPDAENKYQRDRYQHPQRQNDYQNGQYSRNNNMQFQRNRPNQQMMGQQQRVENMRGMEQMGQQQRNIGQYQGRMPQVQPRQDYDNMEMTQGRLDRNNQQNRMSSQNSYPQNNTPNYRR